MKRLYFIIFILVMLLVTPQAKAFAYPNPNRQTMWNNMTDSVHTWGQTPRQAAFTKMRLHNARTRKRIGDINRAKRQAWLNSQN